MVSVLEGYLGSPMRFGGNGSGVKEEVVVVVMAIGGNIRGGGYVGDGHGNTTLIVNSNSSSNRTDIGNSSSNSIDTGNIGSNRIVDSNSSNVIDVDNNSIDNIDIGNNSSSVWFVSWRRSLFPPAVAMPLGLPSTLCNLINNRRYTR